MALHDPDGRVALEATKLLFAYAIGKPRIEVEINETSTMTHEERRTLVLNMLGVETEFPQFTPSPAPKPCLKITGPTPAPSKPTSPA